MNFQSSEELPNVDLLVFEESDTVPSNGNKNSSDLEVHDCAHMSALNTVNNISHSNGNNYVFDDSSSELKQKNQDDAILPSSNSVLSNYNGTFSENNSQMVGDHLTTDEEQVIIKTHEKVSNFGSTLLNLRLCLQATKEFLEIINGSRAQRNISPLSWSAGVKFLMARKFSVRRAIELYQQHHSVRLQEGLLNFDPSSEPLRSELLSGKFTVLVNINTF